ncbi:GPR1/FUN34/yaaH family-domain-containing protein [Radiomyces spectabilis]|uniref:GPR1/FUN34/yaaH family-domain-containing protein n=1 Tax=Radiomyces spectabilis TaxID=64574 RepID=UPI0022200A4F|nr:GPR1/FUN34/yaaH family-domain-containing protein [Radiomyces spectabilis]KAI8367653.1 GPR1/FUN34/yaaH family-domain-containing protein [Radiomyces spectabilis]
MSAAEKITVSHNESLALNMTETFDDSKGKTQPPPNHSSSMPPRKFIEPAAIGFSAFALCSFVLGLYNSGLVTHLPQVAIGVSFGAGAVGQFIAAICEIYLGNTYSATTFLTYSGFFFTYGIMFMPSSGFMSAAMEAGGLAELERCMGLVMAGYAIVSFLFFLGTFRQPWLVRLVLLQVFLTFFFGALGAFTGVAGLTKAGGWLSFTLAVTAWYIMCAILYQDNTTFIKLPFF